MIHSCTSHTAELLVKQDEYHAGLRPRITAQVASLMSACIDLDSDSSSDEEEEEPIPVKKHKGKANQPSLLCVMQAVQHTLAY